MVIETKDPQRAAGSGELQTAISVLCISGDGLLPQPSHSIEKFLICLTLDSF